MPATTNQEQTKVRQTLIMDSEHMLRAKLAAARRNVGLSVIVGEALAEWIKAHPEEARP